MPDYDYDGLDRDRYMDSLRDILSNMLPIDWAECAWPRLQRALIRIRKNINFELYTKEHNNWLNIRYQLRKAASEEDALAIILPAMKNLKGKRTRQLRGRIKRREAAAERRRRTIRYKRSGMLEAIDIFAQ